MLQSKYFDIYANIPHSMLGEVLTSNVDSLLCFRHISEDRSALDVTKI